jgi:type II secretory pathway pseudopilin PulG
MKITAGEPVFASYQLPVTSYGFTYIGLMIFIALLGFTLAGTGLVWHTEARRLKEGELLFAGEQYRRAIGTYYERSPGGKKFPGTIDDLLRDPRYPNVQRHLRRAYADPITASMTWGIVEGPGGGIAGVYSLSEEKPVKRANFRQGQADFEGREKYSEWRFVYVPREVAVGAPARKD